VTAALQALRGRSERRAGGRTVTCCGPEEGDPADWPVLADPLGVPLLGPPGWALPCAGRLLELPPARLDWVHLLLAEETAAAARTGPPPEVWLHHADAVDPEWLHLLPGHPVARLPVTRPEPLRAVRLPELPGPGVLALTLVPGDE
jgi:hypothetical protein